MKMAKTRQEWIDNPLCCPHGVAYASKTECATCREEEAIEATMYEPNEDELWERHLDNLSWHDHWLDRMYESGFFR